MILNDVPAAVWTTVSAIGVAVASGLLTAWASRGKAKADVQTTLNDGFSKLVDKLNTRLGECDAQVKERDKRIDELERELEALRTSNHDFRNQVMQLQGKSRGRTT